jgi:hypothetical protein
MLAKHTNPHTRGEDSLSLQKGVIVGYLQKGRTLLGEEDDEKDYGKRDV